MRYGGGTDVVGRISSPSDYRLFRSFQSVLNVFSSPSQSFSKGKQYNMLTSRTLRCLTDILRICHGCGDTAYSCISPISIHIMQHECKFGSLYCWTGSFYCCSVLDAKRRTEVAPKGRQAERKKVRENQGSTWDYHRKHEKKSAPH